MTRRWNYEDVTWGVTPCELCVERTAECLLEEEQLCLDCADLVLERVLAVEARPAIARELPSLREVVGRGQ